MARKLASRHRFSGAIERFGGDAMRQPVQVEKFRLAIAAATLVTSLFTMEGAARAATGWVSGKFSFWNKNGNYCPSGNGCVGSRYTQTSYDNLLPISNAHAYVKDTSGTVLGQGYTDDNGNFTMSWTRSTFPPQIQVVIATVHTRFIIANVSGQYLVNWTSPINTSGSSSQASPQPIGAWYVGSSASPDPYLNTYWAAEHLWRDVLSLVGSATVNFTGVEVRGFADSIADFLEDEPQLTS
jgi:hypothetical protein